MTAALSQTFEERLQEIETYLDLLEAFEVQAGRRIGEATVSAQQQKILYSSVYVQIYNLVEATITWCVEAVRSAAADHGRWKPGDLSPGSRHGGESGGLPGNGN